MMNRYLIGALLGIVSAIVFASAATGPLIVRFLLFLITPLPIFLAGLGWGATAAAVAGLAGSLLILPLGIKAALLFAASQALPAATLSYLAGLSRTTTGDDAPPEAREWYPAGRLVIWAAFLAGIPALLWVVLIGGDLETLKANFGAPIAAYLKESFRSEGAPLGDAEIEKITGIILALLPAGSAISWMGTLLLNLWLAGRIMLASGQLARPWPDLAAIEYPRGTALALAATTAASLISGWVGLAASGFSGTLLFAYVLLGLCVIHYVTRTTSWRPFLLWGLYATLFLFNAPIALPLALLGLAETFLRFRDRVAPGIGPGPGKLPRT